ncbi:MAG: phosphatidylserine decarboxylase [Chitinophagales bacterium]
MTATRIHREVRPYLIGHSICVLIASGLFFWYTTPWYYPLAWFSAQVSLLLFTLYFFRYRDAALPEDFSSQSLLSPADGHVVALEPSLREDLDALRLSIYLHGTDTHLIRIPCSGKVVNVTYHPGKHLVAFNPKSSLLNERLEVGIEHVSGKTVTMTLVAGLLARRIKPYIKVGQEVRAGEELGYILLGSRVDMDIPNSFQPKVELNQKVFSSESILGDWS